jgi:ribosomal protein S18 acetylase RimI-like enzyme
LETGVGFVTKDGRAVWLRPAVEDDAEAIIRAVDTVAREGRYFLRSRFERDVEQERAFLTETAEQGNLFLLALADGLLVGWVTLFRAHQEFRRHTAELGIGVLRAYRGIGIGGALMDQALRWAAGQGLEKVTLGVRAGNERAQALYRKLGFVEEGRRVRDIKDQHGRYDDTIEMSYFVPQPPGEVR